LIFVYSQPIYWIVGGTSVAAYYALFYSIIVYSNLGVFFVTVPITSLVLLISTSSVLMSLGVAYARLGRHVGRVGYTGAAGSATVVAGGVAASCSCVAPLVAPLLYLIGFNALEVSGFLTLVQSLQLALFSAFTGLNLLATLILLRAFARALTELRQPSHASGHLAGRTVPGSVLPRRAWPKAASMRRIKQSTWYRVLFQSDFLLWRLVRYC